MELKQIVCDGTILNLTKEKKVIEYGEVFEVDDERGYGFIGFKDNEDIFVHYSAIRDDSNKHRSLTKDEIVEFDLVKTENGYKAKNVISIQD